LGPYLLEKLAAERQRDLRIAAEGHHERAPTVSTSQHRRDSIWSRIAPRRRMIGRAESPLPVNVVPVMATPASQS
jgi:hypothetical protein